MAKTPEVKIVKANGERELYSREKFRESLRRSGADESLIDKVQDMIESELKDGMTTGELYEIARGYLIRENVPSAAKYSLKKAIMDLGPAGYLFERYFAAVLSEYGYKTKTNVTIKGECVSHEIDVVAEKDGVSHLIEAKYHNSRGIKSDTKVVLYTYARFLDIKKGKSKYCDCEPWLVTNTKFTAQAKEYGECRGIKMNGWHYPANNGLDEMIESKNLYPVTALPAVSDYAREAFARAGIYFARDLKDIPAADLVSRFEIYEEVARKIEAEAKDFINGTA